MIPPKHIDHELLRKLWPTKLTTVEIAAQLGCGSSHVSHVAHRIGLPRRAINLGMLPQRRIVAAYVEHGLSLATITEQLHAAGFPTISSTSVKRVLWMHGVKLRPRNNRSPLDRAHECLQLLRAGLTRGEIAKKLNMNIGQVNRRIVKLIGSGKRGQVGMHSRSA